MVALAGQATWQRRMLRMAEAGRSMSDLWPLKGTAEPPGLKQIGDSLAHGLWQEHGTQAPGVAHWHFARFAERLAFIVLGTKVPRGLHFGTCLLRREPWYSRSEWEAARAAARTKK
jgi:hypothetical protein